MSTKFGQPSQLKKDLDSILQSSLPYMKIECRNSARLHRTLSHAQVALFDVKNISLNEILRALNIIQQLKKDSEAIDATSFTKLRLRQKHNSRQDTTTNSKTIILENQSLENRDSKDDTKFIIELKKRLLRYRKTHSEPRLDISMIQNPILAFKSKRLYYGAYGTLHDKVLYDKNSRCPILAKTLKFESRLYRMAAAKVFLRNMDQYASLHTIYQSFNYAIKAYKLEVQCGLALPTLSNERLTPPATRLLIAMLGAIGNQFKRLNKKVLMLTAEVASVRHRPIAIQTMHQKFRGRNRGGKPRMDQGKKRYVWLGPHWKPPWAPRRKHKQEEWSWRF